MKIPNIFKQVRVTLNILLVATLLVLPQPVLADNSKLISQYPKLIGSVVDVITFEGDGTGFYVAPHYLITNAHVAPEKKAGSLPFSLAVHSAVFEVSVPGEVVGNALDVDLSVIYTPDFEGVPTTFSSEQPHIGDRVMAIGSPYGLTNTLGIGFITGTNRGVDLLPKIGSIQISTGVAGGSSGSPVFNERGEVIGMVFAAIRGSDDFGFVIPVSDLVLPMFDIIAQHKRKLAEDALAADIEEESQHGN